jgi:hypothetical protein
VIDYDQEFNLAIENGLQRTLGHVFNHVPKEVLAVGRDPETN